ncbi:hypothetical protein MKW98_030732, partial [Papaver atlanticum]
TVVLEEDLISLIRQFQRKIDSKREGLELGYHQSAASSQPSSVSRSTFSA